MSPFVRVGCGNFILTNSIAFFYSISLTSIVTLHAVPSGLVLFIDSHLAPCYTEKSDDVGRIKESKYALQGCGRKGFSGGAVALLDVRCGTDV